jgi:hypothetical protein
MSKPLRSWFEFLTTLRRPIEFCLEENGDHVKCSKLSS